MRKPAETYYRRHVDCALHTGNSFEPDERRGWKPCECPIYFYGPLRPGEKSRRNSTKVADWREAEAVVARWRSGAPEPPPPPPPAAEKGRVTIETAGKLYIASHVEQNSARETVRKYRTLMRHVQQFSTDVKGYVYIDQWTNPDVREFRLWWLCAASTSRVGFGNLKSFFEFCKEDPQGWIKENPARYRLRRNRAQRAASEEARTQRSPFTDAELTRMLAACETEYDKFPIKYARKPRPGGVSPENLAKYTRKWTGADIADFMLLSVYTGLRISDVCMFHASRMNEAGDVKIRALKNGNWVCTWVPEWLQDRIHARVEKFGPYIFGEHKTEIVEHVAEDWRRRLNFLWDHCGPWSKRPTHHRFRHTFVRILLERGVRVETIAELIGDSEEMVRKHYSDWVPGRQDNVRATLQKAFANTPRLQVVGRKRTK